MKRTLSLGITLILVLLTASCGKDPLKQAGMQGEGSLSLIRDLSGAYERRDIEAFMERVSPAYPDRDKFRKEVEGVFQTYQTIKQKVFMNRMQLIVEEKGNMKAVFTWEGEWRTSGGKIVKDGARSTFVIDKGAFKLLGVEGKNPFQVSDMPVPVRQ